MDSDPLRPVTGTDRHDDADALEKRGTTVTDETPAGEDEAAQPAADTGAGAGESGPVEAGGEAVTSPGDDAPEASSSTSETPSEDATGAADETPVAGTAAEPATVDAAAAPAASAAAPSTRDRRGVFVPAWLAALVAVLVVGGIGFAIGYAAADGDDSNSSNAAAVQPGEQNPGTTAPNDDDTGSEDDGSGSENTAPTAFLGVTVQSVEDDGGARINNVRPGSPAADAGLQSGDVITKIGDTTLQDDDDLIRAVRSHDPGDEVTITYTRDGTSTEVTVELGDRSDATRSAVPS